jgi:tetratricopeptide (TPR) repeat protein
MTPKFASKEIHFLKTDSEHSNIQPPEIYFSDLLLTKQSLIKSFSRKLNSILKPEEAFLCAAIRMIPQYPDEGPDENPDEDIQNNAKEVFESAFKQLIDQDADHDKRGVWKSLDDTTFILGLRGYENDEQAKNIISLLKESLSEKQQFDVLIGTAVFPYLNYPKSRIPANALKALDHAAFFGAGAIVGFDAVSLNISGDRLYHLEHYDPAIKEYKEGLKIKPDDSNMLNSLGVCFAISGELKKAGNAFNSALKSKLFESISLYNIGLLHQIEGEPDKAMNCFEKAHKIDSSVFEVELLLAYLLFKKQEYDKAMPYLDAAEQLNPESGLVFRMRGEILLAGNDPENAGHQFNKAIKLNPSDAVSLSGYAQTLELMDKNLPIALIFAQKSLALDPDNPLFQERLQRLREKVQER